MKTTFQHYRYLFIVLFSAIGLSFSCSQRSNIKPPTTQKEIQSPSNSIATTTQLLDSSAGRQNPACCKGVPSRSKIVTVKK